MKSKKLFILCTGILFGIVACTKVKPSKAPCDQVDFLHAISSVNEIKLPVTFFCGIDSFQYIGECDTNLKSFAPDKMDVVAGKFSKNDKYYIIYGVIGDMIYPYLFTYNKDGEKIDSIYLHIGYCLGDEEVIASNITTIGKDYQITMTDTTKYVHYNDDENNMHVDSISIDKKILVLNENGLFR